MKVSKTTLNGMLTLAFVAMLAVHFDDKGHLAMTTQGWFAMALAAVRAGVGITQKDAGVG